MDDYEVCEKCGSRFLGERRGEFVDFDADFDRHGTEGIPLCSDCLGTGIIIPEFKSPGKQVQTLREENFAIQIKMSEAAKQLEEDKKTNNATRQIVANKTLLEENNKRLREISQKALSILAQKNISPFADSLVIDIKNGEE